MANVDTLEWPKASVGLDDEVGLGTKLGSGAEDLREEAVAHSEGPVAKTIEDQTAKLPSDIFLWAALASMVVSLGFRLAAKKDTSLFVGQWAAPFMLLGVYNKIVKVAGSDRIS